MFTDFARKCFAAGALEGDARVAAADDVIAEFMSMPDNTMGGSLHIVLEDSNWEDHSIEWCRRNAHARADVDGYALAELLLAMPMRERLKLDVVCDCGCCEDLIRETFGVPEDEDLTWISRNNL